MIWNQQKGQLLFELLISILIFEVAFLGIAELLQEGLKICFSNEQTLQALLLLRSEMEKLKQIDFNNIHSHNPIKLTDRINFSLNVENFDYDFDDIFDYKRLTGTISYLDFSNRERCYQLVTYLRRTE